MQVSLSPIIRSQILGVFTLILISQANVNEASHTSLTTAGSVPSLNLNKTMCTIGILKGLIKTVSTDMSLYEDRYLGRGVDAGSCKW
jgi:ABC-type enterobactin transport system permease subunit